MAGEHLDLSSDSSGSEASASGSGDARTFVGVRFACCDLYCRIYINRERTAYEGRCPGCLCRVELRISADGSSERFFTAY
jgi:hypothetical protein